MATREATPSPPVANRVAIAGPSAVDLPLTPDDPRAVTLDPVLDLDRPSALAPTSLPSNLVAADASIFPLPAPDQPRQVSLNRRSSVLEHWRSRPLPTLKMAQVAPSASNLPQPRAKIDTPVAQSDAVPAEGLSSNSLAKSSSAGTLAAGRFSGTSMPKETASETVVDVAPVLTVPPTAAALAPIVEAVELRRERAVPTASAVVEAESAMRSKKSRIARGNAKQKQADKSALRRLAVWPRAAALEQSIGEFQNPQAIEWGQQVLRILNKLGETDSLVSLDAQRAFAELAQLAEQSTSIAKSISDRNQQAQMLAASYALQRRLAVWQATQRALHPQVLANLNEVQQRRDVSIMKESVAQLRQALGSGQAAEQWTDFLALDDLAGLSASPSDQHAADRRNVAKLVLDKMAATDLTPQQRQIIETPMVLRLQRQLRNWTTLPVDYSLLMADLERFEVNPSADLAGALARVAGQLRWSLIPQQSAVGRLLDSHYRNANVRFTMTESFANRMLPVVQDVRAPVREEILGAKVFGNSATWTRIGIVLVPDPQRIHLQIQARGSVAAETRSFKGPVVAFNRNRSQFYLRKSLIFDQSGVHIGKSDTVANGSTNLLGLRTQYDGNPLLSKIVRRAAEQQIFEQRHLARRIFERLVANQASENVDQNVTEQLAAADRRLNEKLIAPLKRLGLQPTTSTMQTTPDRIVFRGRLAGDHQLAAFTARPMALANNLVSMQMHESVVNNALQQLDIDGRRGDLRQMLTAAAAKYKNIDLKVLDEVPENVTIQLASSDALRLSFNENRLRMTLRIEELSTARRDWKNFVVSANYTPSASGFQLELSRDGVVELTGRRLSLRDQVALRGIFGKVFSKNRPLQLVTAELAQDQRVADLRFDQIVFRNGWIGVSIDEENQAAVAKAPARRRVANAKISCGRKRCG